MWSLKNEQIIKHGLQVDKLFLTTDEVKEVMTQNFFLVLNRSSIWTVNAVVFVNCTSRICTIDPSATDA